MIGEKRYNSNFKRFIKLNDGERFCPKCDGNGRVKRERIGEFPLFHSTLKCDKCLGDGKIDWIEEATGKRKSFGSYTDRC